MTYKQAALELCDGFLDMPSGCDGCPLATENYDDGDMICQLNEVDDAEVVHGRWIMRGGYFRCSACDAKSLLRNAGGTGGFREYDQVQSKYCPNCGAMMEGGNYSGD